MDYKKYNLKQEYLRQSVMTASPAELVVMLFDACIKNLKLADLCLDRRDPEGANTHFLKAQKIIYELVNCLDTGFELSVQLLELYQYLLHTIADMNRVKDAGALPDVLEILVSFRETWRQIAKPNSICPSEVS